MDAIVVKDYSKVEFEKKIKNAMENVPEDLFTMVSYAPVVDACGDLLYTALIIYAE